MMLSYPSLQDLTMPRKKVKQISQKTKYTNGKYVLKCLCVRVTQRPQYRESRLITESVNTKQLHEVQQPQQENTQYALPLKAALG